MSEKGQLYTTQSDHMVLKERGFTLEKVIGEGSYAKVKTTRVNYYYINYKIFLDTYFKIKVTI